MGRLLLIDNYDSFTWNLVQAFRVLGADVTVIPHDPRPLAELDALLPDWLVISPGPGMPAAAGISCAAIRHFAGHIPILGVCLGHQCIAEVYGGKTVRAREPRHGKTSLICHEGTGLFAELPFPWEAMRYHSLVVELASLPSELTISATSGEGELMALAHKSLPIWGVQFHPESILSGGGERLLGNFLQMGREIRA